MKGFKSFLLAAGLSAFLTSCSPSVPDVSSEHKKGAFMVPKECVEFYESWASLCSHNPDYFSSSVKELINSADGLDGRMDGIVTKHAFLNVVQGCLLDGLDKGFSDPRFFVRVARQEINLELIADSLGVHVLHFSGLKDFVMNVERTGRVSGTVVCDELNSLSAPCGNVLVNPRNCLLERNCRYAVSDKFFESVFALDERVLNEYSVFVSLMRDRSEWSDDVQRDFLGFAGALKSPFDQVSANEFYFAAYVFSGEKNYAGKIEFCSGSSIAKVVGQVYKSPDGKVIVSAELVQSYETFRDIMKRDRRGGWGRSDENSFLNSVALKGSTPGRASSRDVMESLMRQFAEPERQHYYARSRITWDAWHNEHVRRYTEISSFLETLDSKREN